MGQAQSERNPWHLNRLQIVVAAVGLTFLITGLLLANDGRELLAVGAWMGAVVSAVGTIAAGNVGLIRWDSRQSEQVARTHQAKMRQQLQDHSTEIARILADHRDQMDESLRSHRTQIEADLRKHAERVAALEAETNRLAQVEFEQLREIKSLRALVSELRELISAKA